MARKAEGSSWEYLWQAQDLIQSQYCSKVQSQGVGSRRWLYWKVHKDQSQWPDETSDCLLFLSLLKAAHVRLHSLFPQECIDLVCISCTYCYVGHACSVYHLNICMWYKLMNSVYTKVKSVLWSFLFFPGELSYNPKHSGMRLAISWWCYRSDADFT